MKRIIFSFAVIALTAGALLGGTTAFFSDVERSVGNTFAAGALDLKVDNESYYNLNKCSEVEEGVWEWVGQASYPVPGTPCTTSWGLDDLDEGRLFFDFTDVKPDDEGEDTISLHTENDAWACMDLTLTKNDDVSSNEPELKTGDAPEDEENDWDGELAQAIQMFWWADDGDNVYETGENTISSGVKSLMDLASTSGAYSVALADATHNVWGTPGPLPGEGVSYIAKAWCFGTLTPAPVAQGESTGPQVRGTGFLCDGKTLGNMTQTDSATLDVVFRTEQARHNDRFLCNDDVIVEPKNGTITVVKIVDEGGAAADDFSFVIGDNEPVSFDVSGTNIVSVPPGTYDVVEPPTEGYSATYANSQNGNAHCDDLVVPPEGNVTCTITNTFVPTEGTLTVTKTVVGGPLQSFPEAFSYRVNGGSITLFESDGSNSETVTPGFYDVEEVVVPHYVATYSNSENGSANCTDLDVGAGETVTCAITNTYAPTTITIEKIVVGSDDDAEDFDFEIDSEAAVLGANLVSPGAHVVDEVNVPANYTVTYGGSCDGDGNITALANQDVKCIITNTFVPPTPTTITIQKNVVGGTAVAGDFTYRIDGNAVPLNTANVVSIGAHTVTETGGPANYVATFGGDCNTDGTISVAVSQSKTCAITNTFVPATTTILTDDFGTGDCLVDVPGWDEDAGESCVNGTVAAAIGSDDNTASPQGGRFALLSGNNGYMCRSINATGLQNLAMQYYWRGDTQAQDNETGSIRYFTTGTCGSPGPTTVLASHELDDGNNNASEPWSALQTVNLPSALNNTTFFVIFTANSNAGSASFRIDGATFTGVPI